MKTFDSVDIKILDALGKYGPRNIAEIARKLGMHKDTVRKRIERLKSHFFLKLIINPYHTFLGLKKVFVFIDAVPGYEETLYDCLKANDFWLYLGRYFGRYEGCYGIYGVPVDHVSQFSKFLEELETLEITRKVQHYWSTCLHTINLTESWFDDSDGTWIFPWEKWVNEIPNQNIELPFTLKDPDEWSMRFSDYTDLFIIKELQKDGTVSLRKIASMLEITPVAVHYHYKNHVMRNDLLESYLVNIHRFDPETSDFYVFIFRFDEKNKLARFANSLLDKPFITALGKILDENALIGHTCLPRSESRQFVSSLGKLIRRGLLETYEYWIEDYTKKSSQTISYEFYKDGVWVYEHKKHLENLKRIVNEALGRTN